MRDHLWLYVGGFIATTLGIAAYARVARARGILAVPNERTLHAKPTVRGGGVVVAVVFLAGLVILACIGELPSRAFLAVFVGGLAVATLGFIDDIVHLSTGVRIAIHAALAVWAVACIGNVIGLGVIGSAIVVVAIVWMINLFNFMDGIDGMAGSGAVFFSTVSVAFLELGGGSAMSAPLALLACASAGFLLFNWPPASLFMGDSGSGFYGYVFATVVMLTMSAHELSMWTWLIVLGYFVGDTTTTVLIRAARVPRFWGTHRSHAYQNLARVWNDHRKMTVLVNAVQLVWLLPLAAASVHWPSLGPVFAAVALAPIIAFAIKYGPLYDK